MPSPAFPTPTTLWTLTCCLPGLLASTACATRPPAAAPPPLPPVAQVLRDPCPRPDRPAAPTLGMLAVFSVRQEAALSTCEARKDAAVALLDAEADALRPAAAPQRPWWRVW